MASDEDSKSDGGTSAAATGHCGLRPLYDRVHCEPGHWKRSGKSKVQTAVQGLFQGGARGGGAFAPRWKLGCPP